MLLIKNNAYSKLAGALTNVATTMTVDAGTGDRFPIVAAPDTCLVTLQDAANNIEVVQVTARASGSNSMTIVRAQEGTAARAWNIGDVVELRITAGTLNPLQVLEAAATAAAIRTKLGATATGVSVFTAADAAAARTAIGALGASDTIANATNANTLDGLDSTQFARADSTPTFSGGASGDIGGSIMLSKPPTNSTVLGGGVLANLFRDTIRVYENGSPFRGFQLDLATVAGLVSMIHTGNIGSQSVNYAASAGYAESAGNLSLNTQTFTASGTWAKPAVGTIAVIECWGGGGAGSSRLNGGNGGGGGNYNRRIVPLSLLGGTESVTVGAGGTGVASGDGNAGGNTTFGAHCIAYGGSGAGGNAGGGGGGLAGSNGSQYLGRGGGGSSGLVSGSIVYVENAPSEWGGGGGGGRITAVDLSGGGPAVYPGQAALYGGGGGGGGPGSGAGGTSVYAGSGGAGSNTGAGAAGAAPSGGGGASNNGIAGAAGARGECRVTVF